MRAAWITAGITLAALSAARLPATFPDGAVAQGSAIYARRCAACHGRDLTHGEGAPDLIGPAFVQRWSAPAEQQIARMRATMPQDDPGTLTFDEASALRAFILMRNTPPHHLPHP